MSYPVGWDLVNITGTYIGRDGVPCVGSVILSSPQLVLRSGTIVPAADIVFDLVNGVFSGQIPATDDPNAAPTGWVYTVTENVPGGRQGFQIVAPHTSPGIDLSTVVPVIMPQPPVGPYPLVTQQQLASQVVPTGASLVGYLAPVTGAVGRTTQARLSDSVSVMGVGANFYPSNSTAAFQQAATNGGTYTAPDGKYSIGTITSGANPSYWDFFNVTDNSGNILSLPGTVECWYQNYKFFYQLNSGASDLSTVTVRRDIGYTGGTIGFLNAAIRVLSNVNSTANTYETGIFVIQDNYANGSQNFAMGSQANKYGTGASWSLVTEVHEKSGTANPTTGTIGHELDVFANGTDTSFNRIGLSVIAKRESLTGAVNSVGNGISLSCDSTDVGGAKFGVGIAFGRAGAATDFDSGVDFTNATFSTSGAAVQLAHDQSIAFAATNTKSIKYFSGSSLLRYDAGSGHTFDFLDTGAFNITSGYQIFGTQVVTSRQTGWGAPTGTLSRTSLNTGTATLSQVAETLGALITDLTTHGLIGA